MTRAPVAMVEIAGVAGSGKTSLAQMLRERWNPPLETYRVRRFRVLPRLGANAATALLEASREWDVSAARREIARLLPYEAMVADLASWKRSATRPGILEQGPVYLYTRTCRDVRLGHLRSWLLPRLERGLDRFAAILDVVVQLDAPDAVLVDRVTTREGQRHEIEDYDADGALRFLREFRDEFDTTLHRLAKRHSVPIVRIANDGRALGGTADEVVAALAELGIAVTP